MWPPCCSLPPQGFCSHLNIFSQIFTFRYLPKHHRITGLSPITLGNWAHAWGHACMWALSSYYPLTLVYFSYHRPTYIHLFIFICCLQWGQQTTSINITLVLVRNAEPGFPTGSEGKESACNAEDTGDTGQVPGWGRSPGGGNGNWLQYFCLEKSHGQKSLVS